jgi:hypothetical protein
MKNRFYFGATLIKQKSTQFQNYELYGYQIIVNSIDLFVFFRANTFENIAYSIHFIQEYKIIQFT